jgi:hypothetical protein
MGPKSGTLLNNMHANCRHCREQCSGGCCLPTSNPYRCILHTGNQRPTCRDKRPDPNRPAMRREGSLRARLKWRQASSSQTAFSSSSSNSVYCPFLPSAKCMPFQHGGDLSTDVSVNRHGHLSTGDVVLLTLTYSNMYFSMSLVSASSCMTLAIQELTYKHDLVACSLFTGTMRNRGLRGSCRGSGGFFWGCVFWGSSSVSVGS